jgi:hypothetical protein
MNATMPNGKIYLTLSNLSSRVSDIANVFVLPPTCVVGMVLNLLCIICIMQPELKGEVYTFMLIHAVTDFIFLFINTFTFIIRCGVYCDLGYAFLSKAWELYIHLYIGNTFLLFGTLLDIIVSVNRLASFSSTQPKLIVKLNKLDLRVKCVILALISLLANVPSYILTRNVTSIGYLEVITLPTSDVVDSTYQFELVSYRQLFQALTNAWGKIDYVVTLLFILTLFRGVIPLMFLFIINIVIGYRFKRHMKNKMKVTAQSKIEKNYFF